MTYRRTKHKGWFPQVTRVPVVRVEHDHGDAVPVDAEDRCVVRVLQWTCLREEGAGCRVGMYRTDRLMGVNGGGDEGRISQIPSRAFTPAREQVGLTPMKEVPDAVHVNHRRQQHSLPNVP